MKVPSVILLTCVVIALIEVSSAFRNRHRGRNQPGAGATAATNSSCPVRTRPCPKNCGTRGFMRSEAGCELCACKPLDCPAIECPDERGVCPYGPRQDENGCQLCECRAAPRCTADRVMCSMFCPQGFQNGPDGCPTCQCFDPASASQLPAPNAAGVATRDVHRNHRDHAAGHREHRHQGATGGRSSTAAPLAAVMSVATTDSPAGECPPICRIYCPNGMKEDSNGCAICECNNGEESSDSSDSSTPAPGGRRGGYRRGANRAWRRRGHQCFKPVCAVYCPNGNRRDQNGCTLCECHQPGDAPLQVTVNPSLQCQELRCHRFKKCARGFVTDASSGCPSCVCQS